MACPLPFPVRLRQSVSLLRPRPVQPRAGGGSQAGVGSTAWTGPGKRPEGQREEEGVRRRRRFAELALRRRRRRRRPPPPHCVPAAAGRGRAGAAAV